MSEAHSDVFVVMADVPQLNASLLLVNEHLGDFVGPSIDQLSANLRVADEYLTDSEENIENVVRTWNASQLELTGQLCLLIPHLIRG